MSSNGNGKKPPSGDYTIGYGKPPKHTQFRKGHRGHKTSRKGVRNFKTDVNRILAAALNVKKNGRSHRMSTQEGVLMVLREQALKGDLRPLNRVIELASRYNNPPDECEPAAPLAAEDQAILDAFKAELLAKREDSDE